MKRSVRLVGRSSDKGRRALHLLGSIATAKFHEDFT